MAIPSDSEAKILRFYHVKKWKVGTIARQLRVHHTTVRRVLSAAGVPKAVLYPKPSAIDLFLPFTL